MESEVHHFAGTSNRTAIEQGLLWNLPDSLWRCWLLLKKKHPVAHPLPGPVTMASTSANWTLYLIYVKLKPIISNEIF